MNRSISPPASTSTPELTLEVWGATDKGRRPVVNEDAIWPKGKGSPLPDGSHLLVVADGVSSSEAGEVASRLTVEAIVTYCQTASIIEPGQVLYRAIQAANMAVCRYNTRADQASSTVVTALIKDGQIHVASVGDSRAYLIRNNLASRLTRDHTLTQEKVDSGQLDPSLAAYDQDRNIITRSLGSTPSVQVDTNPTGVHPLQAGDILLLCSDGLTDVLSEADIVDLVDSQKPRQTIRRLIKEVNRRGGPDNVSVVMAAMAAPPSSGPGWPYFLIGFGIMLFLLACLLSLTGIFLNRLSRPAIAQTTQTFPVRTEIATSIPPSRVTATPTMTLTPTRVPPTTSAPTSTSFATSTSAPTLTPTPTTTPTPTPTEIPSTSTPTASPAAPSGLLPAPELTDPPEGGDISKNQKIEFKWKWSETLEESQSFQLQIWPEGRLNQTFFHSIPASRANSNLQDDGIYKETLSSEKLEELFSNGPGIYRWTVVVSDATGKLLSQQATSRKLNYKDT